MLNRTNLATTLALIAATILLAACGEGFEGPTADDVNIALSYVQPANVGETELTVTLTDDSGEPISDATVDVRGDMTHAGMQPVFGEPTVNEAGVYTIPFEWTMGGDWVVTVSAEAPNGDAAEETFELTVDGPTETGG